jgi:hypothetical protein
MIKILKFVEAELENKVGGTYEVVTSRVANVERDSPDFVSVYLEGQNGEVWYLILSNQDLEKIQNPTNVEYP